MNAKHHEKEAQIIANAGKPKMVTIATNMAGRGTDIVLGGLTEDSESKKQVLNIGGLHVIGTERHESRSRLLHANVMACCFTARVAVGFDLDVCGASGLVCQRQFRLEENSRDMVVCLR